MSFLHSTTKGCALLATLFCSMVSQADVLKCFDNGQVTYTNSALKPKHAQCTVLFTDAAMHRHAAESKSSGVLTDTALLGGGGQLVNQNVQRGRDEKRRQILLDELRQEEQKSADAREFRDRAAQLGLSGVEKVRMFSEEMALHERNISDLKRELGMGGGGVSGLGVQSASYAPLTSNIPASSQPQPVAASSFGLRNGLGQ